MSSSRIGEINTNKAFKLLWRYLVVQKWKITWGILATIAIGIMELLTGAFLKFLTNTVTRIQGISNTGEDLKIPVKLNLDIKLLDLKATLIDSKLSGADDILKAIILISLIFFVLYLFQGLFQYLREIFMNLAIERVLQKFKSDILRAVLASPIRFFNKNRTGDIISRVNYDVTVLTDTINILIEISRFLIYMLMFVPAMFIINVKFALYTIIFFPVSFIIIRLVASVIKKSSLKVSDNVGDYNSFLEERINRLRFIKVNRTESREQGSFDNLVEKNYQYRKRLIFQRFFLKPSNEVLGMMVLAVLFIFFSKDLIAGNGNVGDIAFFLYLVKTSFKPVKKVARAVGDLNMALISTGKIEDIFDLEKERPSLDDHFPDTRIDSLRLVDLDFSYDKLKILSGINLNLKKGDRVLITGDTGAGKTSLCSLFPLLNEPPPNTIFLNTYDITELSPFQVRSRISFVSGETPLISGTVRENLLYGTEAGIDELDRFKSFLPSKIMSILDYNIGGDDMQITSGEARKIALVRTLLRKGDVLVMDEAFNYMDDSDIELFISLIPEDCITIIVSKNILVKKYMDLHFNLLNGNLHPVS